eukprot:2397051-Prymnesium_polylepis.1
MARRSAPRQALPRSDAREPRAHAAHAHHQPSAQHSPRNKHARPEHCSASTAACAQITQPDLHMHTGCSCTRSFSTFAFNAPTPRVELETIGPQRGPAPRPHALPSRQRAAP